MCRRRLVVRVLLGLLAVGLAGCGDSDPSPAPRTDRVNRVVDGDTVELARLGRARLIGIDTPEVYGGRECFGTRASAWARRTLSRRRVRVIIGTEPRDRYDRLLVYLWRGSRFVNYELVARGLATTLTIRPNTEHASEFARAEATAERTHRGLWRACPR
jgi:micrococcal nuclease